MSNEIKYLVTVIDGLTLALTTTKVTFDTHGVTFYYIETLVAFVTYDSLVCFMVKKKENE